MAVADPGVSRDVRHGMGWVITRPGLYPRAGGTVPAGFEGATFHRHRRCIVANYPLYPGAGQQRPVDFPAAVGSKCAERWIAGSTKLVVCAVPNCRTTKVLPACSLALAG